VDANGKLENQTINQTQRGFKPQFYTRLEAGGVELELMISSGVQVNY